MTDFGRDDMDAAVLQVQRARDDARRGYPVRLEAEGEATLLAVAVEAMTPALLARALAEGGWLLLTRHRADSLHIHNHGKDVVAVVLEADTDFQTLRALADPTLDLATPFKGPFRVIRRNETAIDRAAIRLVKGARLLPAALVWPAGGTTGRHLTVTPADLDAAGTAASQLDIVARAHVPLEGAKETTLVGFRPKDGGPEHVAVIVGDPAPHDAVLVRLHSECFTGDLLGSLKCDCGDQLKGAVRALETSGGGIVLYLAQEGRGIGLMPKLKAYALQDQGFDTVDANTRLGFEVDERLFQPAAEMLKALGFRKVRLMTNNPEKVAGLGRCGIEVIERVPHAFATNPHNERYLAVKRDRTGHLL